MASPFKPKATPRAIPVQRLDSLLSKPHNAPAPTRSRISLSPAVRPAKGAAPAIRCSNPACSKSDVRDDGGIVLCASCGLVINDVQITQELTFGEAANGAAVVQGVYVGADDENARNTIAGSSRITGGLESRQITEKNLLHHVSNFVGALRLNATHKDRAMQVCRLAIGNNFIQGRTTKQVAAVCLYIGCRKDAESRVMLIDLAELLEINVFKLGQVYNDLIKILALRPDHKIYDINPENLIQRFAQDLEFGKDEHRIANEAVQVLKRMKRDWIVTGRRPAGVCAAALILAARMNNYRRTIREVVYTAKVCDITIHKRLEEFKYTESSKLTVEEFRHHGLSLEKEHDPPAFYEQFLDKRKRRKRVHETGDDVPIEDLTSPQASVAPVPERSQNSEATSEEATSAEARARADRAAMPPPRNTAIDPALLDGDEAGNSHLSALAAEHGVASNEPATGGKRRRGKPKGTKNKPLPVLTDAAIEDQNEIEAEVEELVRDPETIATAALTHEEVLRNRPVPAENETAETIESVSSRVPDTEYIDPNEFEDDDEVANCLLSPAEITVKERIWVQENHEWLLLKQRRKIGRELAEKYGTVPVKKKRIRRRGRMGDGNWNRDGDRPSTPAESCARMLQHRGYSKKINYDRLNFLFDKGDKSSESGSVATGRASSNGKTGESSRATTPASTPDKEEIAQEVPQSELSKENVKPEHGIGINTGLQTPRRTAPRSSADLTQGANQQEPIEIQDNGTPSGTEDEYDDEDDNPDDYFQDDEDIEAPEEQYEFEDEDEEQ